MTTFTQNVLHPPPVSGVLTSVMNLTFDQKLDLVTLLQPETPLESLLISLPEFHAGYNWGTPRYGHPEGKVGLHVREVLDNVDRLNLDPVSRHQLRLIAIAHDTFKFRENKNHQMFHGKLARVFMEQHIGERFLLDIIELHDEAYYIWKCLEMEKQPETAHQRLEKLMEGLGENMPLFYLFFKSDTETGDKIQTPLRWFERLMRERGMGI